MIFSSTIFLFAFFPVFFLVLFIIPQGNMKLKNAWIIVASLFFYAWGAGTFIIVVLGTLVLDYLFGNLIDQRTKYSKVFVALDVVMNIGILLYFKYFNFFMDNVNVFFTQIGWNAVIFTRVILPLGVSFVIFQKMTYCLDIAKGSSQPSKNYFDLVEYLLIFPQIVAGPIVKYSEISEQIKARVFSRKQFLYGFCRLSVGLFKKVWIADVVAQVADCVFLAQASVVVPIDYAWIGIVAYTFQIFFDFSAYSDMAIGMLAMMGFHIPENFNKPYTALSITDFWKRWHISMTSWFREYLYIPLGGNRKGVARTYFNLWIVFLLSGFWHGTAWNFVLWGAYHGLLLCVDRALLRAKSRKLPTVLHWAGTFFLVMIGWVFFRADSVQQSVFYIANMFDFGSYYTHLNSEFIMTIDPRGWFIFILAAVICFLPLFKKTYGWLRSQVRNHANCCYVITLFIFYISAMKVITGAIQPFIYFRF